MPVTNSDIARIFARYAELLEIDGANPFRVRAYQNAARVVDGLPRSVADLVRDGADLTELEGIGADLARKIAEIVTTGRLGELEELERRLPPALVELTALPGVGPRRARLLYDKLQVRDLKDLERAARAGLIEQVPGFGPKTAAAILRALAERRPATNRIAWLEAERVAEPLVAALRAVEGVDAAVVAGSFRRHKETVGDLDLLVTCADSAAVMDRFTRYEDVAEIVARGATRSTVRLRNGLQVDLRVVPQTSYGAALQYFTGSKAHNIALRSIAVKRGLKLSEYGLFEEDGKRIAGRTEEEIYRTLGLAYIEPELREDSGEIEAAATGALPKLVTLEDIRGDLHCHTDATDGRDTLATMAEAAERLGYEYLAITDHTRRLTIAKGQDPRRLRRQLAAIDRLNGKLSKLVLLKSAEVDILEDGTLDLPDDVLRDLDVVIGAIHYKLDLPAAQQTDRLIRAMDNPYLNVIAHPTGRLIGERDGYPLDMERLMTAAAERGCILEVNAQPKRLDLTDACCRMAKGFGLKLAISTDSHSAAQLAHMRLGVAQARRGWLEPGDVLNTRRLGALRRFLKRA